MKNIIFFRKMSGTKYTVNYFMRSDSSEKKKEKKKR